MVRLRRTANPPSTRCATRWKSGSRGKVSVISSIMVVRFQLFLEIVLTPSSRSLRLHDGRFPTPAGAQRRPSVRDPRRETRELLDRSLDREAHRADRLV